MIDFHMKKGNSSQKTRLGHNEKAYIWHIDAVDKGS